MLGEGRSQRGRPLLVRFIFPYGAVNPGLINRGCLLVCRPWSTLVMWVYASCLLPLASASTHCAHVLCTRQTCGSVSKSGGDQHIMFALLVRFKPASNKVPSKHTYPCSRANVAMSFNGEPPPKRVVHINRNLNNVLSTNRSHIGIHTQKATTCSFEVLWEAAENQRYSRKTCLAMCQTHKMLFPLFFSFSPMWKRAPSKEAATPIICRQEPKVMFCVVDVWFTCPEGPSTS